MTADPKDELRRLVAPYAGRYLTDALAQRILDAGWRPVPAEPLLVALNAAGDVRATMRMDDLPSIGEVIATLSEWAETDPKRRLVVRVALNPQQEPDHDA